MEKLIYLDNAATTLRKPARVAEAVAQAILTAGNAAGAPTARPYRRPARYTRRGKSWRGCWAVRARIMWCLLPTPPWR